MREYATTVVSLIGFIVLGIVMMVIQRAPTKQGIPAYRGPFAVLYGAALAIFACVALIRINRARRRDLARKAKDEPKKETTDLTIPFWQRSLAKRKSNSSESDD